MPTDNSMEIKETSWPRDLAIVALVTIVGTAAFVLMDGFEYLNAASMEHERWVHDIYFGTVVVALSGLWFTWRRRQEVKRQLNARDDLKSRLQISNKDLSFLISATPGVLYISEPEGDGAITFMSAGIKAQHGYDPSDFTSDPKFWIDHIHPADKERVVANMGPLFEQDCHEYEYRFQNADGSYHWVRDQLVLIRDLSGKPDRIVGYCHDISVRKDFEQRLQVAVNERTAELSQKNHALHKEIEERRKLEEALKKKTEQNERLIASLPGFAFVCDYDEDWTMCFVSDAVREILGYAPDDLIGNRLVAFGDLVHPDDQEAILVSLKKSLAERKPFEREYRIKTASGSERTVWERSHAIYNESGKAVQFEGYIEDVTDRKWAEQRLREREHTAVAAQTNSRRVEKILRDAIESISEGFVLYDRDGRLVVCNTTYKNIYDRASDLMVPGTLVEDIARAAAERGQYITTDVGVEDWIAKRLAAHKNPKGPREIKLSDGRWVEVKERKTQDGGIVGVHTDITELKLARKSLEDRERFIRAVVDNVLDAIITIHEDGQISSFNESAERMFGVSKEQVIGQNIKVLMPEPYRSGHDGYLSSYLSGGQSKILGVGPRELNGVRNDGSVFPIELAITETNLDGERFFIGAIRDITDRKQAEEALRRMSRQNTLILDAAGEGIYGLDREGRVTFVNPAATQMIGWRSDELIGKSQHDLIRHTKADGTPYPVEDCPINVAIRDGKSRKVFDEVFWHKDGNSFSVDYVSTPIYENGEVTGAVVTFRDITEHKEIEAQLRQAQKMDAIGQLTGGVAHDFNNLLTVIMGNARLLERRLASGDAVVAKNLGAIIGATRRSATLTQQLLAFSRKESLEPKLVDGRKLVSGMVDMMRRTLGEMIKIEMQFADEPLNLVVDPNGLESALLNLATNARDAMPEGGTLTIALAAARTEKGNCRPAAQMAPSEYALLSVSDTGVGIPAEYRDKIFEPFFTTKDVGKGTGLGLSMVFGFVKQSGGHIEVSSEEGRGTTFRLYLPMAGATCAFGDEGDTQAVHQPGGCETILVVEDEAEVREIAVSILKDLGYRVIEAEDGPDALAKLEEQPGVDLLFTDMVMPGGMTGYELAEQAKHQWPGLKVLYTSGYANDALSSAGKDIRLVQKPYEDTVLAKKVKEALGT